MIEFINPQGLLSYISEFLSASFGEGPVEIVAAVLSIIAVYLTTRESIWCWPIGIVACALYIHLLDQWGLKVETLTWVYYLLMNIVGWIVWTFGRKVDPSDKQIPVRMMNKLEWTLTIIFILGFGYGIGRLYSSTTATIPYADAFTSALSFAAQFWMARKYLECWGIWLFANFSYIIMYSHLGQYPTVFVYIIYFGLAWKGYVDWKDSIYQDYTESPSGEY